MKYFLSQNAVIKWLEMPFVYHLEKDDLYELDRKSFKFLKDCSINNGCIAEDNNFIKYCIKENILTKESIPLKRPSIKKSPEPSLRYLELQITDKCNLKCKHCYINKRHNSELSLQQINNILKEFEDMQGLRVLITGGEPLLHKRFNEVNELINNFFIRKVLFTNGILLNKKVLKKLNVNEIQISIDGLEEAHDSLRGKGTFKLALKSVKNAIDSGFHVSISTMVHAKNLNDFDEMERLFKRMNIKDWTVDIPCITGRLEKNFKFQLRPKQAGKYLRYGYGNGVHTSKPGFACGLHLMAVMADGKVSKCSFYSNNPVGRIEDGLRECWRKIQPIRINKLKCDCKYINLCRGGCRYRAELLGDPLGRDLYKCAFYGII